MNILFIDDTEQLGQRYVGIGGVILHDSHIGGMIRLFDSKKEHHGIPAEEEIKWSPKKR